MKKKLLLILSMVLVFVALFAFSASAAENPEFNSDSYFKPVDYDTHKSISKVTLYGNADYICMKAYSETNKDERFALELYSDSKYKNKVAYYNATFNKGKTYENIFFDLTGLKSGKYYAKAFVDKESSQTLTLKTDPDSVVKFKVTIKRGGRSSIKKTKVFMYGYENTEVGPVIYWYNVPKADGYYIYRYEDKKYKKIATVKATDDDFGYYVDGKYKDKNATKKYKIRAYNEDGKTGYSENYVQAEILKTPKVKVSVLSSDRIKISWNSVDASAEYAVLRRTKNSDWKLLEETTSTSVYDWTAKNNTVYYYTVIAGTKKAISGYDVYGVGVRFLKAPTINQPVADGNGLLIKWQEVKGADSYAVYRKIKSNDTWEKIATVGGTAFTDTTIQKNQTYYYTVKALKDGNGGSYKHTGVYGANFDAPELKGLAYNADGYPVLTWSAVKGCKNYTVMVKEYGKTEWTTIETTDKTQLIIDSKYSLNTEKKYVFTVRGFVYNYTVDYGRVYTPFDTTGLSIVYYDKLTGIDAEPVQNGLTVKWNAVNGADKYAVYRKTADTEYNLLETTDKTSYIDETVEKDVKYTYKITYFCGENEVTDYGSEKDFTVVDNNINLSTDKILSVGENYSSICLAEYDENATYYIYRVSGDNLIFSKSVKTANGCISFNRVGADATEEYIIVSVSADGIVKGFENAEKITVEYFSFTGLTASVDHYNETITLKWLALAGAKNYIILRDNKEIAIVTNSTSYVDENAKAGVEYAYSVRAVKGYLAATSDAVSTGIMRTPTVRTYNNTKGIGIAWNSPCVDNAVYRKAEGEKGWKKIKTVKSKNQSNGSYTGSYTDKTAESGKTYYYTVRAINSSGQYSNYDRTGAKQTRLEPVKITSFKTSNGKITIKWDKVPGAENYKIYRGNSKWFATVATVDASKNTCVDEYPKKGEYYYYKVNAINDDSYGSSTSTYIWAINPPKLVSAKASNKGITVKFKPVKDATDYVIYRKKGNGSWKKIAEVSSTKTEYVDKKAKKGVKYTYTVSAKHYKYSTSYNTKGVSAKRK